MILLKADCYVYPLCLLFQLKTRMNQTFETVFHWLSKHFEFCQKYSTVHHTVFSNSCLLGVWISWWITVFNSSLMFNILLERSCFFNDCHGPSRIFKDLDWFLEQDKFLQLLASLWAFGNCNEFYWQVALMNQKGPWLALSSLIWTETNGRKWFLWRSQGQGCQWQLAVDYCMYLVAGPPVKSTLLLSR